jgi:hypothetical protein
MKELFSRAPNGDLNGDGVTKVATYVAKMNDAGKGSGDNNEKAIEDAVKLVYNGEVTFQRVDGPVDTSSATMLADDPATYSNYDADMAKLVAPGVDGHSPDFIAVNVIPGFAGGIAQAYALANLNPRPPIAHAASSMRAFIVQELGDSYNGQEGIGNEVYRADASGTKFAADFTALTGAPAAGYDSSVYDAMVTNLLAVLKAALPLADPTEVTPTQVKQAFSAINVPGAQLVRTGTDEFVKAIDAIAAGTDFNYEGASGPVDFDAVGDVRGNVAMWKVENQKFVTEFLWNCIDPPADLSSDWFASPHTMSCPLVQ